LLEYGLNSNEKWRWYKVLELVRGVVVVNGQSIILAVELVWSRGFFLRVFLSEQALPTKASLPKC